MEMKYFLHNSRLFSLFRYARMIQTVGVRDGLIFDVTGR